MEYEWAVFKKPWFVGCSRGVSEKPSGGDIKLDWQTPWCVRRKVKIKGKRVWARSDWIGNDGLKGLTFLGNLLCLPFSSLLSLLLHLFLYLDHLVANKVNSSTFYLRRVDFVIFFWFVGGKKKESLKKLLSNSHSSFQYISQSSQFYLIKQNHCVRILAISPAWIYISQRPFWSLVFIVGSRFCIIQTWGETQLSRLS